MSLTALASCSGNTSSVHAGDNSSNSSGAATPSDNAAAPQLTYANGWTQVTLVANYAKTFIDNTGHFSTDRNACGQSANGVIDLSQWNTLASAINDAVAAPETDQEAGSTAGNDPSISLAGSPASSPASSPANCPTEPDGAKMDGTMDVTLDSGATKSIFVNMGPGQVCSRIIDPKIAQRVYDAINLVVTQADQTDCAHL